MQAALLVLAGARASDRRRCWASGTEFVGQEDALCVCIRIVLYSIVLYIQYFTFGVHDTYSLPPALKLVYTNILTYYVCNINF